MRLLISSVCLSTSNAHRRSNNACFDHLAVEHLLEELGIMDCSNTMIGNILIKGISGGQKKRTSVGVEMITDPSLLFLDEPTSGLDSFAAFNLVKLLKAVASEGAAILCTIHQVFKCASDLFLRWHND